MVQCRWARRLCACAFTLHNVNTLGKDRDQRSWTVPEVALALNVTFMTIKKQIAAGQRRSAMRARERE